MFFDLPALWSFVMIKLCLSLVINIQKYKKKTIRAIFSLYAHISQVNNSHSVVQTLEFSVLTPFQGLNISAVAMVMVSLSYNVNMLFDQPHSALTACLFKIN